MAKPAYKSKSGIPDNVRLSKSVKDSIVDLLTRVLPDAKSIEFFYEIFGVRPTSVPTISFKTKMEISPRVQSDLEGIGLFPAPMGYEMPGGRYGFMVSEAWLGR
ncbi:MAG: hypothetical protein MPK62_01670 [Alphaproteobacteria bacterium]|nr:hypothetical protein [Alphaproteobacteria bacterium]MDA8029841.1 hypothetical protein [Alphaproteobacteria bacterium]